MAQRGRKPGTQKTGGRKAGSINRHTTMVTTEMVMAGITPLEYMFKVLREPPVTQMEGEDSVAYIARLLMQEKRREWASQTAAPYVHPRLTAVEYKKDEKQHAEEQAAEAAKLANMDIKEVARRIAFIFAEAQHQPTKSSPESRVH